MMYMAKGGDRPHCLAIKVSSITWNVNFQRSVPVWCCVFKCFFNVYSMLCFWCMFLLNMCWMLCFYYMFLLNVYSMLCLCYVFVYVECLFCVMFLIYVFVECAMNVMFMLNVFSMWNVYVVRFYFFILLKVVSIFWIWSNCLLH
jgi:hypothetical protein